MENICCLFVDTEMRFVLSWSLDACVNFAATFWCPRLYNFHLRVYGQVCCFRPAMFSAQESHFRGNACANSSPRNAYMAHYYRMLGSEAIVNSRSAQLERTHARNLLYSHLHFSSAADTHLCPTQWRRAEEITATRLLKNSHAILEPEESLSCPQDLVTSLRTTCIRSTPSAPMYLTSMLIL
jgi:hypothetical protein